MTNTITEAELIATHSPAATAEAEGDSLVVCNMPYIDNLLAGGTYEHGLKIADAISEKIVNQIPLSHALIIEGIKGEVNKRKCIVAARTPLNLGLLEGFGLNEDRLDEIYGGNVVRLGAIGVNSTFENIWKPSRDLSEKDIDGMKRKMRDAQGRKLYREGGITVLPQHALRATLTA